MATDDFGRLVRWGGMAAVGSEERVARAEEALRVYGLSEEGWRRSPSGNLRELLTDLLQWCDATQHGFERALAAARAQREAESPGAVGAVGAAGSATGAAGAEPGVLGAPGLWEVPERPGSNGVGDGPGVSECHGCGPGAGGRTF